MLLLFSLYSVIGLALAALVHYMLSHDLLNESRISYWVHIVFLISLVFIGPFLVYILLNRLWTWFAEKIPAITLEDYL